MEMVESARKLWQEIPEKKLPEAMKEAMVAAKGFVPSIPAVVAAYRAMRAKPLEADHNALWHRDELERRIKAKNALAEPLIGEVTDETRQALLDAYKAAVGAK